MSTFHSRRCLLLLVVLLPVSYGLYTNNNTCRSSSIPYLFNSDVGIFLNSEDNLLPTSAQHRELLYHTSYSTYANIEADLMQLRQALDNATHMLKNLNSLSTEKEALMKSTLQDLPNPTCSDGYSFHENMCYKAFTTPQNQYAAYSKCLSDCGDLAKARTESIDKFLISLKNAADPQSNFWFGLKRLGLSEKFYWVSNESDIVDKNTDYTNWAPGRPDDLAFDKDCVLYLAQDSNFPDTWDHLPCFATKLPYLCSTKCHLVQG